MKKIIFLFLWVGLTGISLGQSIDLEDGIVGYYPFNNSAEDKTGNGNDAFVKGATTTQDRYGNANSAYRFDGRNQSIRIPFADLLDFTQKAEYSISLWIRPRDVNSGCILMKNYDYGIKWGGMKSPITMYSGISSSFMETENKNWRSGDWYNLVIVQERNQILLYINGSLDYSEKRPHETANKQEDIHIGRHPYFWGAFEGDIDDICIFNRALDQLEAEALFQIETMPVEVKPRYNYAEIDQNILAGTWQGVFSQPGNDNFDNYAYWLKIEVEGKRIKGWSRTEIANTDAFGIMQVKGNVSSSSLNFTEEKITRERNPSALDWCKKFAKLRYDPSNQSLRGKWLADNCKETGEVILFKSDIAFNFYDNKSGPDASIEEIASILASNRTRAPEERESVNNRRINIEPITFVFGSTQLTSESRNYIKSTLVNFLKEANSIKLRISGHTDNVGEDATNLQLSINRAKAVANYIAQNGIESNRLSHEGFGESKPIANNSTQEGRRKNRRVEINIEEP